MIIYDVWSKEHFYHHFDDLDVFVNSMLDKATGREIGEDSTEWNVYGTVEEFYNVHDTINAIPGMVTIEESLIENNLAMYKAKGPAGILINFIVI
jgi:hypothetical protein|tara:strand:- start:1979 stop:2263 length:285 start_codon:yes stop_codon:yes gene_type:complete